MKKKELFISLSIAVILAVFSFLASSSPDGLERVAEDKSFINQADSFVSSPMPDYVLPGIKNEKIAGSLAGVIGVITVFLLSVGLAKILKD